MAVVMKKDDYYDKCNDDKIYQKLKSDPTNKFKEEFLCYLKDLKG